MFNNPPMYLTTQTPQDIIGRENLDAFNKFYGIASSPTNAGEFPEKRLNKEIGAKPRKYIAETLSKLRSHGYYPDGFSKNGRIMWGIVTKSESQVLMEKGLPALQGKSRAELRAIVKGCGDVLQDIPALEPWDINNEELK